MKKKEIKTAEEALALIDGFVNRFDPFAPPQNETIDLEGGYISYNPNTDTGAETAVVKDKAFMILLGDYRKEYKDCKTIFDAIKVFKQLVKDGAKVSMWSNYE